jgi:hypothetical protein
VNGDGWLLTTPRAVSALLGVGFFNSDLITIPALLLSGMALISGLFFRHKKTKQAKKEITQPEPESPAATRACYRCGKAIAPGRPVYHVYVQDGGSCDEMLAFMCGECYAGGSRKPG